MVSDKDVWRVAKYVMEEHGADAPTIAAQCAEGFMVSGKLDAERAWKRIAKAVEEFQRATPRDGETVN